MPDTRRPDAGSLVIGATALISATLYIASVAEGWPEKIEDLVRSILLTAIVLAVIHTGLRRIGNALDGYQRGYVDGLNRRPPTPRRALYPVDE